MPTGNDQSKIDCFEKYQDIIEVGGFSPAALELIFNIFADECDDEKTRDTPYNGHYTRTGDFHPETGDDGRPVFRHPDGYRAVWTGEAWKFYDNNDPSKPTMIQVDSGVQDYPVTDKNW